MLRGKGNKYDLNNFFDQLYDMPNPKKDYMICLTLKKKKIWYDLNNNNTI